MKVAVIGAGAIGNIVAGYLKLKNEAVGLIGRASTIAAIKKNGLRISGVRGEYTLNPEVQECLTEKPDLVILAVKTQDLEQTIKDNLPYLEGVGLLTTQNGVEADKITTRYFPYGNLISSIIMFGATYLEEGKVVHNFEGGWIIGRLKKTENDIYLNEVQQILNHIFPTTITDDIWGMKYLKIFLNANNCIPAILGISMQEAFSDHRISQISIAIWKEGLKIVNTSGISLASLPDFPLERLTGLTQLPLEQAAQIFSGIMVNLSKEPLYGSILQSIKRGRSSEIDFINGEFVKLA
ncbi:MAG: 2-dehydropantoate 2-reductase, partial [Desulfobacterota bacterium]|nr:2-dehydropantoate 2-reductase [Thermodesulfobacteriota bacterium]